MTKQTKTKVSNNEPKEVQNVQELPLANIMPNPDNPRKTFDENSIRELADSIQSVGLIQPITVRPCKDEAGKYIIIAGERRFRACTLLVWKTISCIVKDVSDEVAMEIALIENLQRKEVPVMEEATAFKWLIESGRYDYTSLASKVGVSEVTIRKRIKLTDLIPELLEQVDKEVPLGHAEEICKYSEDIQREVMKKYEAGVPSWQSFRGLTLATLKEKLVNEYTCILSKYHFDQSECRKCPNNTGCSVMFDTPDARCLNVACLKNKANLHIVTAIEKMIQERPELVLLERASGVSDPDLVGMLNEKGIEIKEKPSGWDFSVDYCEGEPERDDFEEDAEFEKALAEYKRDKQESETESSAELEKGLSEGTIFPYIELDFDEPRMVYYQIYENEQKSSVATDTPQGRVTALKEKAKREKELVFEKTLADCRVFMKTAQPITSPLAEQETQLIYFVMLESLPRDYWPLMNIPVPEEAWKTTLSEEQRAAAVKTLTEEQKRLIERVFIFEKTNNRIARGPQSSLFVEWVRLNYPEDVASFEKKYTPTMKKRMDSIAAKLAVEGEKLPDDLEALRTGEPVPAAVAASEAEEQDDSTDADPEQN